MTDTATTETAKPRSQWADVWDQFRTHRGAMIGMGFFVFVCLLVIFGPMLWHLEPNFIDIRAKNQGPSLAHPFGTDQLGRDTFAQVLAGGRVSLLVGVTAMLLAL
ncbi:MAG TPA: ABC transporter permease, partial [Aliiroseovarius sp.]|nr:ABC transporter permease [Aliiroseovarius sp.]